VCGTAELITREKDGETLIDEIRCPGCDRVWKLTKLAVSTGPIWSNSQTDLRREGDGTQKPKPMPFPEPAPPTPHLKCVCGRHLQTRARNDEPWHQIRCDGSYGCERKWTLSDSYDGEGYVWFGQGVFDHPAQAPWNAVRRERNPDASLTTQEHSEGVERLRAKRKAQKPLKLRGVPCPDCDGKGGADVEDAGPGWFSWHDCKRCGGTGEIA
jgi:hypothetical protein